MSRVTYTNTPDSVGQDELRAAHGVRLVAGAEEGTGVNALPEGVYGFTYSPGLPNAPLFATRRYRSYETHKVAGGDVFIVAFATEDVAQQLALAPTDVSIQVHPEPRPDAAALVQVPYSRIRRHRQYAAPNEAGFTVTVAPAHGPDLDLAPDRFQRGA